MAGDIVLLWSVGTKPLEERFPSIAEAARFYVEVLTDEERATARIDDSGKVMSDEQQIAKAHREADRDPEGRG